MRSGTLAISSLLVVVVVLAGCGRIGFELDGDARPGPDADLARVCGASYQPVAGLTSRYRDGARGGNWAAAELDCESDGGHLAVPNDPLEAAYLHDRSPLGWVGVSDHFTEGVFRSVTGAVPTFIPWDLSEPTDTAGDEDCVEVRSDLSWNDMGCGVVRDYVCECDGERMPVPPVWCDTRLDESCGTCGNACLAGATCVAQDCVP